MALQEIMIAIKETKCDHNKLQMILTMITLKGFQCASKMKRIAVHTHIKGYSA